MADMDALLQPVTLASAAELLLERWSRVLNDVDLPKLVQFARMATNIRNHQPPVTALNGLLTAIAEIRSTGGEVLSPGQSRPCKMRARR